VNTHEELEKAWKAGFECAMANAWVSGDCIWSLNGDDFKNALNEYINTKTLVAVERDGIQ
jgi:hypothetical protein